jgi:hypothetical protein
MNDSPYNACDYLCERCKETDNCSVYQSLKEKELLNQLAGKDKDDPENFLQDVQESLNEAKEMLEKMAAELNVDPDEIADIEDVNIKHVEDDPLYKLAHDFTMKTHHFLKEVKILINQDAKTCFEDIAWYHTLVSVKIYRAIGSAYDGLIEDAINSTGVALKSLNLCIKAFNDIAIIHPDISKKCRMLSKTARAIKKGIEVRFITDSFN